MPEFARAGENILAIVVRGDEKVDSIEFYSPTDFSQQIGLMRRPANYEVALHSHNEVERKIMRTQEVLIVRSGLIVVTVMFDNTIHEFKLKAGDSILLAMGAHKVDFVEESELLEIKQGPFLGSLDKRLLK